MMATLYIARNIKEPIAMWGNLFAAMSNGSYFVQEIQDMELTILKGGVEWHVYTPPTST